jgi:hypothetical protein
MNTTRKNNILILILLVCSSSCNLKREENKPKEIEINFSREWKLDTLGCLGIRQKIATDSLNKIKQFIGSSSDVFYKSFGNPYSVKKNGKNSMCLYWISCCKVPKLKEAENKVSQNIKNTEATHLVVEVDSTEIIKSIKIILP